MQSYLDGYTKGKCYLIRLKPPFERIQFQFLPKEISITREIKSSPIEVVGRNIPKYHVTGGAKTIQLELEFYAEDYFKLEVMKKLEWLESLTYNEGINNQGIEKVKLVFGDIFKDETWLITGYTAKIAHFMADFDYMPLTGSVSLTLTLDLPKNPQKQDVLWRN